MKMSKINVQQLSDNEVEVTFGADTPMEMVNQLTKGLSMRGLVEDLQKSTLSTRYFYRPQDRVNDLADKLIKSLNHLAKDELPYWHPEAKAANRHRNRMIDARVASEKIKAQAAGTNPAKVTAANVLMPKAPKAPGAPVLKNEDCDVCGQDPCICPVEKSNYGPKGAGQYTAADNAKRKMNNVGATEAGGKNSNIKSYNSSTFGGVAGYQTNPATKKRQPVKTYSQEERDALASKMGLKKSWASHNRIPSADEEVLRQQEVNPVERAEDLMANQLANMMNSKAMLNPVHRQPSAEDFIMAGEQMGLGVNPALVKSEDAKWGNVFNNWLAEASKPISSRFSSEEEEMEYWRSLGTSEDRDDGSPGY